MAEVGMRPRNDRAA